MSTSTTYTLLIHKIIKLDNNIFSHQYDGSDNINGIYKIFFNILLYNSFINYKYKFFVNTLNNFYFIKNDIEKNEFINLFSKIQKNYFALTRFAYLYKLKRAKIVVDTDMQLNKICSGENNVISIYHYNCIYLFKIDDLLKIIYMSLINNNGFFIDPIPIKNPYNNIIFNKSILYYIYFYLINDAKIKHIKPEYLDVFFKFKRCNFNMNSFYHSYEYLLREYTINNYIDNTNSTILKGLILHMLNTFNYDRLINQRIIIDDEFPDKDLISIMKPYLLLFLQTTYSLITQNRNYAKNKLYNKLVEFQQFNPTFGRKIVKLKTLKRNGKCKRVKSHIEFSKNFKKFNTYDINNFMLDHVKYSYENTSNSSLLDILSSDEEE